MTSILMNISNKVIPNLKLNWAVEVPAFNGIFRKGNIKLTMVKNINAVEDSIIGAGKYLLLVIIAMTKKKANAHIQKENIYEKGTIYIIKK